MKDWIQSLYIEETLHNHKNFYLENGKVIFKREYHLKRGFCCGSGCRHCCYTPPHTKGSTDVK